MVGSLKKSDISIVDSIPKENFDAKDIIIDYDTFLSSAGEFGRYQWFLFFSTMPFYIYGAFTYFGQMFMTEVPPNYWCWVPELVNLTDIKRRTLAIPLNKKARFGYDQCHSYDVNWTELLVNDLKPNSSWPITTCQNGWEYNRTEIPYPTISTDKHWVCEKSSYQATAQSIFFVGSIVGGLIIGWIADRYGRLPAATCSNMIGCIAGIASTFTTNFTEFAICRFFVGIAYDNCMIMTYLLSLEYVAPKYRTLMANLPFALFYTLGCTMLPWIALACGHWKTLCLATSIPLGLAVFAPLVIPESPRWLISKGRIEDTVKNILNIASVNGKTISPLMLEQFKMSAARETNAESIGVLEISKRPLIRMMFICICLEYMCCMIIFDVSARSVGQLEFDFFVSFTVVSLTEFPSLLLVSFILDLIGRRWLTIAVMIICCVFSFLTAFIAVGLSSVLCATVVRFTVNMALNTAMQWGAEILPTPVRGSGAAVIHICGYVATVISPFIAYLSKIAYWLPLGIVGCTAVLCAILAFLLPETANKELPQNFADTEDMIRAQKLWDFPCSKKHSASENGQVNRSFEMN